MFTFPVAHFGGDLAYTIDQSLRLDGTGDMSRTVSSDGNLRTWTFAFWLKRSTFGTNGGVGFNVGGTYVSGDNRSIFRFHSTLSGGDDDWYWAERSGAAWREDQATTSMHRDPAAWAHYMCVWDTDGGTTPRARRYINGVLVSDLKSGGTVAAANVDSGTNQAGTFQLFDQPGFAGREFEGYAADMYFLDGVAATPSDFGEFSSDTGQFVPIAYSGSFGSNGFYLDFADSSDLGKDVSGNGNHFTTSSLSSSAQVSDSPTDNFCVMNVLDNGRPANITLSDGNLTAAFAGAGYNGGIRSSIFFDSEDSEGWYAECTLDSLALASVFRAGVANASLDLSTTDAQTSADGWAYSDQGAKLNNSYTTGYGSAVTTTDVVGIAVRNGKIYFAVNNVWQGSADPVTESNPAFSNLLGDVAFCQSTNTGGSYAHTATWNFGQTGFTYTPPTGFKALSTANLPTPSITDGSAYFQTSLWNGNSSTQTITQSGNSTFEPGMIWSKGRDNVQEHVIFDQVRGATKYIQTDNSGAEGTQSGVTAFNSDGFDLGSWAVSNGSGQTHVGWQWKANGAGSSNTDGDITSTVSANTTAGFSIVKYSGNGSDNQTIGHGLGIAPKMIISKRTDTTGNWTTYHDTVGINQVFYLDLTNAPTSNTEQYRAVPTSSVYTLGVGGDINNSSGTYVAYVFAEVEGFSKISSFEGNSNADGTFVYTGFKPAFILTKNMDTADQWGIRDAVRNPFNVTDKLLNPNASTAETTSSTGYIDILSNGFKARSSDSNINSNTIIYYAVAESPFKTANAR